jgi:hypothetical protein
MRIYLLLLFGIFLIHCAKCRTFDHFKSLKVCGPYLSNATVYYKPTMFSEFIMNAALEMIKPAISPDCFSNVLAFACRRWFKECREVITDSAVGSVMLPSLMVREAEVITPKNLSDKSLTLCPCSANQSTFIFGRSASMRLRQMQKRKRR